MKNAYEVRGDVTAIFIDSPKYGMYKTLIDTSDFELVNSFSNSWYVHWNKYTESFYVVGNIENEHGKRITVWLNRWLLGLVDPTIKGDHKNHDTLDNRRSSNLRVLTHQENLQNRKGATKNSKSGIRGVSWHKPGNKWVAQLTIKGKVTSLGLFTNINDAEKAVKLARSRHMPSSFEKIGGFK